MRQLGSACHLEHTKSYHKSIERDIIVVNNASRMTVSQSAPHTPVSSSPTHQHDGAAFRTVPRLLSEPIVGARCRNNTTCSPPTKTSRLENNSSFLKEKKLDNMNSFDMSDSFRVKPFTSSQQPVPVHSPKGRKDVSKFFVKSPLMKRDTMRIQVENSINLRDNNKDNVNSISDGTHV